jgi:hypothetical protein
MVEAQVSQQVGAVFEKMLHGRAGALDVSAPEAEGMVATRLRLLSIYTQPGVPSELSDEFGKAIKLTEGCHRTGKTFVTLTEQISSFSKLSSADLLSSARRWLDTARLHGGADTPFADELEKLRDRVLLVLVDAMKDPSRADEAVSDIIRKDLTGLSDADMNVSMNEAAFLVRTVKDRRDSFDVLATCAQGGMICRGMLYSGLVETLGSRLERGASWEKFKDDLADVPVEAMSVIPVVGDVIGKAKLIFDMCTDLINKEKALKAEVADLAAKHARARDFVELYSASLLAWASWAVALQKVVVDMVLHTSKQL